MFQESTLNLQPSLIFDDQIAETDNPNIWIVKQSILKALNSTLKSEIPSKNRKKRRDIPKLTQINDDPLINQMAGNSLSQ